MICTLKVLLHMIMSDIILIFFEKAYFVENGSLIQIAPRHRQFAHKKPLPKFLTLFAGPLFNFILALILFIALAYFQGTPTTSVGQLGDHYRLNKQD